MTIEKPGVHFRAESIPGAIARDVQLDGVWAIGRWVGRLFGRATAVVPWAREPLGLVVVMSSPRWLPDVTAAALGVARDLTPFAGGALDAAVRLVSAWPHGLDAYAELGVFCVWVAWWLSTPSGRASAAYHSERRGRLRIAMHWNRARDWEAVWDGSKPWALDRAGERYPCPMPGDSVLIGGRPGSGKSVGIHSTMAGMAADPHVHFVAVDLKGGVELRQWERRCDVVVRSKRDALALLEACDRWIDARLADMADWSEEQEEDDETFEILGLDDVPAPSQRWPHLVIVGDEIARLMTWDDRKVERKVRELMAGLIQRGRAAGVWLLFAAQAPKATTLPTDVRDQFGVKIVGAATLTMTNVIAGDGSDGTAEDWGDDPPWKRNVSKPAYRDSGKFIVVEGGDRTHVRFVRRSRLEIARIVRATAHVAAAPLIVLDRGSESDLLENGTGEVAPPPPPSASPVPPVVLPPGEPSLRWNKKQLAAAITLAGGTPPRFRSRTDPNKEKLLAMYRELKVPA